jgi:hypothetical protein
MAEVHQKQMEALQLAHNQQFASVLQYLENLGHTVVPQCNSLHYHRRSFLHSLDRPLFLR